MGKFFITIGLLLFRLLCMAQTSTYTSNSILYYISNTNVLSLTSTGIDIIGKTKTTNLQVTNGAANGYIGLSDASGNLSWSSSIADARLSSNIPRLNANNSWTGTNSFLASNSTEGLKLGNTKIYASSNTQLTIDSYATNGDLIIDKNSQQMAMKVDYGVRRFGFDNNFQQNHNCSFTDGADTSAVVVTDSTRTLRIYKGSAVTTTKIKVTLPTYPTPTQRITLLCETDPTSITFFSPTPTAQPILGSFNFSTVGVGDVIELWFIFADGTGVSNTGKWYIKKQ